MKCSKLYNLLDLIVRHSITMHHMFCLCILAMKYFQCIVKLFKFLFILSIIWVQFTTATLTLLGMTYFSVIKDASGHRDYDIIFVLLVHYIGYILIIMS